MAEKRVTITDIARELGVSVSSVSRALSGRGYAAADVKERIQTAAKQMGYVPDLVARNLRQGSSNQLGLIVTSLVDAFYSRLASGFHEVARANGYEMALILDRASSKDEVAAIESLLAMGVEGLALTPVTSKALSLADDHNMPLVQIDRSVSSVHSLIAGDNQQGARMATDHLLRSGHRRIAFLIDHVRWSTGFDRLAGWRTAYADHGLVAPDELIFIVGDDDKAIAVNCRRVVDGLSSLGVTAIFAANSVVAETVYSLLLDAGIKVPADISLIAYDDMHWTKMVRPRITVVHQYVEEMGRQAAELLLRSITSPSRSASAVRSYIRPTLILRDSVLPIAISPPPAK